MGKKYHINHQGNIFLCRASIRACPYGEENHADFREDLFEKAYKTIRRKGAGEGLDKHLQMYGLVPNLSPLSDEIEQSKAPIELITSSLLDVLNKLNDNYYGYTGGAIAPDWVEQIERAAAYNFNEYLSIGRSTTDYWYEDGSAYDEGIYFPAYIQELAKTMPNKNWQSGPKSWSDEYGLEITQRYMKNKAQMFEAEKFRKNGIITRERALENYKYLESEFHYFAGAINASNIVNNTNIYSIQGDKFKTVEENLADLNDNELLAFYDEISIDDNDAYEMLQSINFFIYEWRNDLSHNANSKLAEWFNRNNSLSNEYVYHSLERTELTLKTIKEMEQRNLTFGDKFFNEIILR